MIYFIQDTKSRLVKVGFTDGDPLRRLRQLQTGTPGRLRLLGSVPGDRDDERELHRRYRLRKVQGEWFDLTEQDVREKIELMQDVRGYNRQMILDFEPFAPAPVLLNFEIIAQAEMPIKVRGAA